MTYLPFIDPVTQKIIQAVITPGPEDIAKVVNNFPDTMKQARAYWGKFDAGVQGGLFNKPQKSEILDWYAQLPYLWDGIKNNWLFTPQGLMKSDGSRKFYDETESWINKLRTHPSILFPGVGLAFLLIAGVIIVAAFGAAGCFWAIGYLKKQNNINRLIDEVVAGTLPASVLEAAVNKENEAGFFGQIKDIALLGIGVAALYLFWPQVKSFARRG